MRISQVSIHNYRSVCDLTFDCRDLMVLLGPNNHGKSNILRAIGFALTPGEKVTEEDLFSFCAPQDTDIWVELTFIDLTAQESKTLEKYVRPDGSVKIRKWARFGEGAPTTFEYRGYLQEPEEWWLKSSAYERLSTKDLRKSAAEEVPQLRDLAALSRLTKPDLADFQRSYIRGHAGELSFSETLEDGPLLGVKQVAGGVLPEYHVVPAVRDLTDETKTKGTTMFGRLLQRAVREMAERDDRFAVIQKQLGELVEQLNERGKEEPDSELSRLEKSLKEQLGAAWGGVELSIRVQPPDLNKVFELGTSILVDDGVETGADQKGHGLQRALVFALVRVWASALRRPPDDTGVVPRKSSNSVVFAIEEPELFLHPQAQRQLAQSLADLSAVDGHQVFLCTHSTHFVDLDKYKNISIVSRDQPCDGSGLRQCTRELFAGEGVGEAKRRFHMAAWINPDRGEMFFARRVILVEGESEKAVLPFVANRLGCLDASVSVIDCGSKYNLPLYIEVCEAFGLDYLVVHDSDQLPDPVPLDWCENRVKEKQRAFAFNSRIAAAVGSPERQYQIDPDLEGVCGISATQADRKGKAIAAIERLSALETNELPGGLVACVRSAYARSHVLASPTCSPGMEPTSNA